MSTLIYQILGALSGLVLYWSVSPQKKDWSTFVSLVFGSVIATVGAPFTASYLSRYGPFTESPDGLFVAAAINGLVILPAVRYISLRANKDEEKKPDCYNTECPKTDCSLGAVRNTENDK
jgi:purine-cytosine permease-like protein